MNFPPIDLGRRRRRLMPAAIAAVLLLHAPMAIAVPAAVARAAGAIPVAVALAPLRGLDLALAAGPADLGKPTGYVTDTAGALGSSDLARIETYLGDVERALQVQFAVVIVPTVAPQTIEEYSVQLFQKWGIGGAKNDEGLLLCIAVQDRALHFETGYGLEGTLPDGRLGGIIRGQITPQFKAGDMAGGILAGLTEAARFIAEERHLPPPVPTGRVTRPRRTRSTGINPLALFFVVMFLGLAMARSRGGRGRGGPWGGWGGPWYGGGLGGGGFGGGGGGGFGGGGFGGFGGGSSGGGGASGSW